MVLIYAFAGVLCLGLAPLFGKTVLDSVNPLTVFSLRTLIAAVLIFPWFISTRGIGEFLHLPLTSWLIITIEAILAALLGDLAYFYALKNGSVHEVALIMSCAPLITIILSYFIFHEMVTLNQVVGALLITAGLVLLTCE